MKNKKIVVIGGLALIALVVSSYLVFGSNDNDIATKVKNVKNFYKKAELTEEEKERIVDEIIEKNTTKEVEVSDENHSNEAEKFWGCTKRLSLEGMKEICIEGEDNQELYQKVTPENDTPKARKEAIKEIAVDMYMRSMNDGEAVPYDISTATNVCRIVLREASLFNSHHQNDTYTIILCDEEGRQMGEMELLVGAMDEEGNEYIANLGMQPLSASFVDDYMNVTKEEMQKNSELPPNLLPDMTYKQTVEIAKKVYPNLSIDESVEDGHLVNLHNRKMETEGTYIAYKVPTTDGGYVYVNPFTGAAFTQKDFEVIQKEELAMKLVEPLYDDDDEEAYVYYRRHIDKYYEYYNKKVPLSKKSLEVQKLYIQWYKKHYYNK